ncbi:MAG: hypothetical protein EAZ81_03465 [Verrucomicrobia bacterium]|nr:MAG: hypothetical protein EAZ81_03465 [Verrucomicrobiota bacterium]
MIANRKPYQGICFLVFRFFLLPLGLLLSVGRIAAQTPTVQDPELSSWVSDDFAYSIQRELSEDLFLISDGADMTQQQLLWKEGNVRHEVKRRFPRAIIGGKLSPLSNGNYASLKAGGGEVEIYDATLTQKISTTVFSGMAMRKIWKDYALVYDFSQRSCALISLVSAQEMPILLSHPVSDILYIDLSQDESELYLMSASFMTVHDKETGILKKTLQMPGGFWYEKSGERMVCWSRSQHCWVFDPQALPDGAVVGNSHQLLTEEFWRNLFPNDYLRENTIEKLRVFDGKIHAIVTIRFSGPSDYESYPIQQKFTRYVVMDPETKSIIYQAEVFDFDHWFKADLISDQGKTLIIYQVASGAINAAFYDVSMSNPVVDLVAQDARGPVNQWEASISLTKACAESITLSYSTSDGSAKAGEDYQSVHGSVTFAPGEVTKKIHVPLLIDAIPEGREFFHLRLSTLSPVRIRQATTLCIIDDLDESYSRVTLGPYQLLTRDKSENQFVANFGDSFLMNGSIGSIWNYQLFDSSSFALVSTLSVPSDFRVSRDANYWKRSGDVVSAVSYPRYGDRKISLVQFSAKTGNLLNRKDYQGMNSDDNYYMPYCQLIDHQTFVTTQRFFEGQSWRNVLEIFSIDHDEPVVFVGNYRLFEKISENRMIAIRQVSDYSTGDLVADIIDLSTRTLTTSIRIPFVQGTPKYLHQGFLISQTGQKTYCYDVMGGKLQWLIHGVIKINDIANGMILGLKQLIEIETGRVITKLEADVQRFVGNHLLSTTEKQFPVFFRNEWNDRYPETPMKRFYFRLGQGATSVRVPFTSPLPWDATVSFDPLVSHSVHGASVNVAKGARYVDLPFFIGSIYPSFSSLDMKDEENICQLGWIKISPVLDNKLTYSLPIKYDLLSGYLNQLSHSSDLIIPLDDLTGSSIHQMIANDEYVVMFHGIFPNTYITIHSWRENRLVAVLRVDPSQRFWHQRTSLTLHENRLIIGNPGNVSSKPKIQYPGTVSIFDLGSLSYLSHFRSPIKNDIGFGVATAMHGNLLAVTSQRTPFSIIDILSPYRPPNYAGKVHVLDLTQPQSPRLLRTLSQNHSGFGAVLAMNDQHLYVSAPHATSTLRDPKTRKTARASYAGLIFQYPLANLKTYKTLTSPTSMPLGEFGHSFCLHEGDLLVGAVRGISILPTMQLPYLPNGYTYDAATLTIKNWIMTNEVTQPFVAQGGFFWRDHNIFYCPKMGMMVLDMLSSKMRCAHQGIVHYVKYNSNTGSYELGARPMELMGDFRFWSIHKLGNLGRVDSTIDYNQNGRADWNEFRDDHRAYFKKVSLYEEIIDGRYGFFKIPYTRLPAPPSGTRADWINQEENTREP